MAPLNPQDIGHDHKHWLAELERWQSYQRLWGEQQVKATQDVSRVLQEHEQQLKKHVIALDALLRTIANCERAASSAAASTEVLQNQHEMDSRLHNEQRAEHERLKAAHHRIMLAVSILKGEPFREE